ncbi:MAG: 5-formyltetrahydrofolate cyclo-ligase [Sedimentisphaerales bacterium]|nr:5-formyltetrahydrofolate cyclo-ligase [Sedimentisphaerales bacterium]
MPKTLTRLKLKDLISRFTPQQRLTKSLAATELVCALPEFQNAQTLLLFLTLDTNEPETESVIRRALEQGKTVAIPKVVWDSQKLVPVTLDSMDNLETVQSRHGIRWPKNGRVCPTSKIDLAIVPGLAFDETGHRLGRGGGFYDRFLGPNGFSGATCGLAFEEQVLDSVPVHDHDVPLDMLVTDAKIRRFRR